MSFKDKFEQFLDFIDDLGVALTFGALAPLPDERRYKTQPSNTKRKFRRYVPNIDTQNTQQN